MSPDYLFVYGSLRKDTPTPLYALLQDNCTFETEGYFKGKLYDLGRYPGAVACQDTICKVFGELYRLTDVDKVFRILDAFEGCSVQFAQPHEYVRKKIQVVIDNGNAISAWAYLYNREVDKLPLIPSGDYVEYLQAGF